MMSVDEIKRALDKLLPVLTGGHVSVLVEKDGALIHAAQFESFTKDEVSIQKLVTKLNDRQIIVDPGSGELVAYCSSEAFYVNFKLISGAFKVTRYGLNEEPEANVVPLSGKSLEEEIKGHFSKEPKKRSS